MTVGESLRRERSRRSLTMEALAGMAGVSKSFLSEIENGHRSPSARTLAKLAAALGMTAGALLDGRADAPGPLGAEGGAMATIREALLPLDGQTRARVLAWAALLPETTEGGE